MNRLFVISFILLAALFTSCSVVHKTSGRTISGLHFLSEYDTPHGFSFKGTTVGGLSSIDYNIKKDEYYLLSDDRSAFNPSRFYTTKIHIHHNSIDSVQYTGVTILKQKDGTAYPNSKEDPRHTPDPEALRYNAKENKMVWSSEGERIVKEGAIVLEDPAVTIIQPDGTYIDTLLLPANMHMQPTESGPRQNGVFEGMAFAEGYKNLYVNVEEPLYQDGPRAATGDSAAWIRILKYDVASRKPLAQYAYHIEPVVYPSIPASAFKINGVPDILNMGNNRFLIIERSFSTGHPGCVIRVFLADFNGASDVSNIASLKETPAARPVTKKLLLNMDSLGRYIDNIEGVTFGPTLDNGHQSLLFVADDNFSKDEKTQFLLFEIIP